MPEEECCDSKFFCHECGEMYCEHKSCGCEEIVNAILYPECTTCAHCGCPGME